MEEIDIQQTLYKLFKKTKGKYIQRGNNEKLIWYVEDVYFKDNIAKIKLRFMEGTKSKFLQVCHLQKLADRWNILSKTEFNKFQIVNNLKCH